MCGIALALSLPAPDPSGGEAMLKDILGKRRASNAGSGGFQAGKGKSGEAWCSQLMAASVGGMSSSVDCFTQGIEYRVFVCGEVEFGSFMSVIVSSHRK